MRDKSTMVWNEGAGHWYPVENFLNVLESLEPLRRLMALCLSASGRLKKNRVRTSRIIMKIPFRTILIILRLRKESSFSILCGPVSTLFRKKGRAWILNCISSRRTGSGYSRPKFSVFPGWMTVLTSLESWFHCRIRRPPWRIWLQMGRAGAQEGNSRWKSIISGQRSTIPIPIFHKVRP